MREHPVKKFWASVDASILGNGLCKVFRTGSLPLVGIPQKKDAKHPRKKFWKREGLGGERKSFFQKVFLSPALPATHIRKAVYWVSLTAVP